jgi:hypothetical protein
LAEQAAKIASLVGKLRQNSDIPPTSTLQVRLETQPKGTRGRDVRNHLTNTAAGESHWRTNSDTGDGPIRNVGGLEALTGPRPLSLDIGTATGMTNEIIDDIYRRAFSVDG